MQLSWSLNAYYMQESERDKESMTRDSMDDQSSTSRLASYLCP